MATARQSKLAQKLIENQLKDKPEPIGVLLESVGYAKNTAEAKPGEIIAQEGVQQAIVAKKKTLVEALEEKGIDSDKIAQKISVLLNADDTTAIDKGLKHAIQIRGDYAPQKSLNLNLNADVEDLKSTPELLKLKHEYEEKLRKALINPNE